MSTLRAIGFFALDRIRCVILVLSTIVLLKMAAIGFFAPLMETGPAPGASVAAIP